MTPRRFGHGFGFQRQRFSHDQVDEVSKDGWAIGASVALALILGGALYAYVYGSNDRGMLAAAPADETWGQSGSRPTLPTLPY